MDQRCLALGYGNLRALALLRRAVLLESLFAQIDGNGVERFDQLRVRRRRMADLTDPRAGAAGALGGAFSPSRSYAQIGSATSRFWAGRSWHLSNNVIPM